MAAHVAYVSALVAAGLLSGCTGPGGGLEAHVADVRWISVPESAEADSLAQVCWRVEGTGRTDHTDVHYDEEPIDGTEPVHRGNATFPDDMPEEAPQGYTIPAQFCAHVPVPEEGSLYVMAHALDARTGEGVTSMPREIASA